MRVLDDGARQRVRRRRVRVDDLIVRFDPELVEHAVAGAPTQFTLRARNPDHDLVIGGDHVVFGSVGGPAFVNDVERGRRPGTLAEQAELPKRDPAARHRAPRGWRHRSRRWICRPRPATSI